MPHYDIRLRIVCGETTCAVSPGNFCGQVYAARFGTEYHCAVFEKPLRDNEGGWLARLPECIAASTPAEKPKGGA